MIILFLEGGLGNQMFQYAFAKSLAIKNQNSIQYDDVKFRNPTVSHEKFWLNIFPNIDCQVANKDKVFFFKRKTLLGSNKILKVYKNVFSYKEIVENGFEYNPSYLKISAKNIYVRGFFQSEKYFKQNETEIKKIFMFPQIDLQNKEIYDRIKSGNSVSIHIRRGDYLSNPTNRKRHGICSIDYYKKAIDLMVRKIPKPEFFFFSDDINWVRNVFRIDYPSYYIDWNSGLDSYRDMQLMSNCKHHVIANSTFSWWGAWLGSNQNKIVIAPEKWFKLSSLKNATLIPHDWILL